MNRLLLIFLVTLAITGCSRVKYIPLVDTTRIVERERVVDTLERIERDTSSMRALLECDSLGQVRVKFMDQLVSENQALQIKLENNELKVKALAKQQTKTRETTRYIDREKIVNVPVEKIVYSTRRWQKILMLTGVFYLVKITINAGNRHGWWKYLRVLIGKCLKF